MGDKNREQAKVRLEMTCLHEGSIYHDYKTIDSNKRSPKQFKVPIFSRDQ